MWLIPVGFQMMARAQSTTGAVIRVRIFSSRRNLFPARRQHASASTRVCRTTTYLHSSTRVVQPLSRGLP